MNDLLKLRQLLYLAVQLYVQLVVFVGCNAWITAIDQIGYVFKVCRLDRIDHCGAHDLYRLYPARGCTTG